MATSQSKTRKQIRHSVGLNTETVWLDAGSIESAPSEGAPSANKIIDHNLEFGSDDEHRGKWVFATDSNSSTELRRVRNSSPSERSLTASVTFSRKMDTSWTYELWESTMSPTLVHDFIDQSITEATRKGSVPFTSDSFHTGGGVHAWGLSSAFSGIRYVEFRRAFTGEQLTTLDNLMSSATNSTVVTDTSDRREGSASNEITVAAGAGTAETVATDSFSAVNMRGHTNVEFWIKSNITTTSSSFRFQLNEGSTNRETIAIPALASDSWTRVDLALVNPELDSAISRFVVQTGSSDIGAAVLHVDEVAGYKARSEDWVSVPQSFWRVDKDRRELRISKEAGLPYAKLQVTAVKKPALLSNDSDICEIDPNYVTNSATAKAFRKMGEVGKSDRFEALAQQQRVRMNTPSGIVWVDD